VSRLRPALAAAKLNIDLDRTSVIACLEPYRGLLHITSDAVSLQGREVGACGLSLQGRSLGRVRARVTFERVPSSPLIGVYGCREKAVLIFALIAAGASDPPTARPLTQPSRSSGAMQPVGPASWRSAPERRLRRKTATPRSEVT
jgi:hypothetical protein